MSFEVINSMLLKGFGTTCLLFILTLVLSLPLGLLIMFGLKCPVKAIRWLFNIFVWIIRGTPLMLQLFVVFYVPSLLFGLRLFSFTTGTVFSGRFVAALITFVINYACYFSVIFKGGVDNVSRGQYEAGKVLGLTKNQIFFKIVLLQVIKSILSPISNEVITLVKDTSLARVISVAEIFFVNETEILSKAIVWPLFYIGVFFLIFVGILTLLFNFLEKKLSYFKA
nr:amino acid ABC transporter permease [Clostridia bacterium]